MQRQAGGGELGEERGERRRGGAPELRTEREREREREDADTYGTTTGEARGRAARVMGAWSRARAGRLSRGQKVGDEVPRGAGALPLGQVEVPEAVDEAAQWWQVCTAPLAPVIEAAEVTNAAAELLPEGDLSDVWGDWTKAVAAATGAKGRGLFMPIRQALTGQARGPEIAPLLPFIGRQRIQARLRGERA